MCVCVCVCVACLETGGWEERDSQLHNAGVVACGVAHCRRCVEVSPLKPLSPPPRPLQPIHHSPAPGLRVKHARPHCGGRSAPRRDGAAVTAAVVAGPTASANLGAAAVIEAVVAPAGAASEATSTASCMVEKRRSPPARFRRGMAASSASTQSPPLDRKRSSASTTSHMLSTGLQGERASRMQGVEMAWASYGGVVAALQTSEPWFHGGMGNPPVPE
ncbi:hypothetical protein Vretimale_11424 [Volvox reticuliferus]|uniref:Uncharacterized protein n=1 Tax=Volvox reticuliferus TaxID=1737510 RepID=A0A8J4LRZ5_9CHLO|nr:hypothetical protein Vretimale_11424 [Volvox reticuliferus]